MSSVFRSIADGSSPGKADRLFRASVAAFCSLTRPSRREIAQIDDLALPLYEQVSPETLRFAAAALSECRMGPAGLISRLAGEPIDIAAPLLIRSSILTDVDLIAIIGRSGLAHARAIGKRGDLNPRIAALVRMLEAAAGDGQSSAKQAIAVKDQPMTKDSVDSPEEPGSAAETMRNKLRSIMAVGGQSSEDGTVRAAIRRSSKSVFERLRATALTGTPALFQTALADALEIGFSEARGLTEKASLPSLCLVLRGLDLTSEQAFLLASSLAPSAFPHPQAIRHFIDRFETCHPEAGRDEIRRLRGETLAALVRAGRPSGAKPRPSTATAALKAS